MAAISRAAAGRGQGHSHEPRRTSARRDPAAAGTGLENAERTPSHLGRFLKACGGSARGTQRCPGPGGSAARAGSGRAAPSAAGSASRARLSSVLSRVAQLESKIRSQKMHLEPQNADSGLKLSAEESTSPASGHQRGARGKQYPKNDGATSGNGRDVCSEEEESTQSPKKNVTVKQQLGLDSDEEEMRELMESSLGFSSGNEDQKVLSKTPVPSARPPLPREEVSLAELSKASSFHNKDSEKSVFGRVNAAAPSPTSRSLAGQTMRSPLLSSPMKDNTTLPQAGYTKQRQESLGSDRSEIKSLDELFSTGADAEDPTSSSSKYFRLNILSLDDLARDITSEAAELKQKGEDIEVTQESNRYGEKDPLVVEEDQAALKMPSAVTGVGDSPEEDVDKSVSEAEISEHLSGVSSDFPPHKQDSLHETERTLNSEYSDDFESSLCAADRDSVEGGAESCCGAHPSSPRVTQGQHQATVTETGVQTEPPFTCCWAQVVSGQLPKKLLKQQHQPLPLSPGSNCDVVPHTANPSAVLAPPSAPSYIDPVPIASHSISMEAVEALTTHSPSVLLLHSLCKQHLLLTQQFVQSIHHLHTSLVESLEHERFHYHTLEEAKEYIKNHKPPPLTIEQALEEIRRAQENELLGLSLNSK